MGKNSKQRKSNKVPTTCYHGCTKKEFNNCGEHYKIIEGWDKDNKKDFAEFYNNNQRVLLKKTFGRYVSAHITADFLKGKDDAILFHRLCMLLDIRYAIIPQNEGKGVGHESENDRDYKKHRRDITTERGRINCIAREIPCDCMEAKRIAAKLMEQVARYYCCQKVFSKKKMLRCKGCNYNQYCSKECSIEDWPEHGEWCKRNSVASASSAPTPGSLPSFEDSTDLDTGEE